MKVLIPILGLLALSTASPLIKTNTEDVNSVVNGRSASKEAYSGLMACVLKLDASCALDKSEDILEEKSNELWAEVNKGARDDTTTETENPTALVESISKIISELTDMFKSSLEGLFKEAKEGETNVKNENAETDDDDDDDDDDEDEEEDKKETEQQKSRQLTEEGRGKKKKKKKALIKLLMLGLILKAKLGLLLKVFAAHLQIKFLAIAAAGLLINAVRLYFDLKKGHSPQKVIYYEHAQHQHHYEGGDEDWTSPGGHWARSYTVDNAGQDKAYSAYKPSGIVYSKVNNKPNYSFE